MIRSIPGGRLRGAAVLILLAVCGLIGAVGSARAAEAPARTVRYADLDLTTVRGARVLYGRIVSAAYRVCASDNLIDLDAMTAARACREEAVNRAVRDVNSPMLASLAAGARF